MKTISLVVPVYNEEEAIDRFLAALSPILARLAASYAFEIVFVNDGSFDRTLPKLLEAQATDPRITILDLSRNFGKEAALTAGLDHASGEAVIPIDADLQDPPELIETLLARWQEGFEVVVARRSDRSEDSWPKRTSAKWFYRAHNLVADFKIPENVGDFRLLDRTVVEALKRLPERRRFMKGLFSWVGFKTAMVDYRRQPRSAGRSAFTGIKLWNFALEGITSFSTAPLQVATYAGILVSFASFVYLVFIVGRALFFGIDVPGYPSILASILFLGGLQMLFLGIIGQYVGRIYMEVKERPIYIIRGRYPKES